jgi:hypothetical protein
VRADAIDVAAIGGHGKGDLFDLILLATKAPDALDIAPQVVGLLAPHGVIVLYRMAALLSWRGGRLKGKASVLITALPHHAAYARFVRWHRPQRMAPSRCRMR